MLRFGLKPLFLLLAADGPLEQVKFVVFVLLLGDEVTLESGIGVFLHVHVLERPAFLVGVFLEVGRNVLVSLQEHAILHLNCVVILLSYIWDEHLLDCLQLGVHAFDSSRCLLTGNLLADLFLAFEFLEELLVLLQLLDEPVQFCSFQFHWTCTQREILGVYLLLRCNGELLDESLALASFAGCSVSSRTSHWLLDSSHSIFFELGMNS